MQGYLELTTTKGKKMVLRADTITMIQPLADDGLCFIDTGKSVYNVVYDYDELVDAHQDALKELEVTR